MSAIDTMRWAGRGARHRAGAMGHSLKDRVLEKRLERSAHEAERLRFENDLLRDEVAENKSEHGRILELLEARLDRAMETDVEGERKGHRGRWVLFLGALGAGAFAWFRMRTKGATDDEWSSESTGMNDLPAMTRSGTATI